MNDPITTMLTRKYLLMMLTCLTKAPPPSDATTYLFANLVRNRKRKRKSSPCIPYVGLFEIIN